MLTSNRIKTERALRQRCAERERLQRFTPAADQRWAERANGSIARAECGGSPRCRRRSARATRRAAALRASRAARQLRQRKRRGEMKRAAHSRFALHPDASAHQMTRFDEIVSPSPVPPKRRVVDPSAWLNASKIIERFSSGMPMPVSLTRKCSSADPSSPASFANLEKHVAALGELERVADQVGQDLLQPRRIAQDFGRDAGIDVVEELQPLLLGLDGHRLDQPADGDRAPRTESFRAPACATRSSKSRGCR